MSVVSLHTEYTATQFINCTGGKYESLPNSGFIMMMGAGHSKMMEVLFCEYEGRPIRINEVGSL